MAGKLIVLYGINNLGKTTQAVRLVDRLTQAGYPASYLKYPIYDLKPSGSLLNTYLRENNPLNLSPREAQIIYALNRFQYQPRLIKQLDNNQWFIAEDYTGTGLAWGWGAGVSLDFLESINEGLRQPDLALWLDGQRFVEGIEVNHKHENDDQLMNQVRDCHRQLAEKYQWQYFQANQSIEDLNNQLWSAVEKLF